MNTTNSIRAAAYGSAALVLAAAFSVPAVLNAATDSGSVVLTPPEPTGPHAVGRTELHLVDPDRGHPWVEEVTERDVMVSVWYPAGNGTGTGEPAPYVTPSVSGVLKSELEQGGLHRDDVDFDASRVNALQDVPAADTGPFPVVLYSPGFRESRFLNASNIEQLVSQGYVVAAMDHPYETLAVDMPDGRVLRTNAPNTETETYREAIAVRRADARLVLDGLADLAGGGNPDASGQEPPSGLGGALDLDSVGMFGHSAGGLTTAEVMLEDDRVDAGLDLDGSIGYHVGNEVWSEANLRGADRPFALLTAGRSGAELQPHHSGYSAGFRTFVEASSVDVLEVYMADGEHMSYTDHQWVLPAVDEALQPGNRSWADLVEGAIGTVDPEESVRAQRAYVTAFFDAHLRGERDPILDAPSPDLPVMEFVGED
ncbi:alpha/beta hydrolase family protein [Nocardiopsis alborubida]|uniref:Alpha/beta hydrolase n=1 Tax=Nocardiopsis alborubida TaxID=146802 RepID=A0A7X6RNC5_9ACTN|nr:acetylhydrolase [Nocardiopsis alborubida]NKY96353.1 alpha/beta hydrolase [Nocardiopsis alborubida]